MRTVKYSTRTVRRKRLQVKDAPVVQLRDVSVFPDDAVLKKTLGRSFAWYARLLRLFAANDMLPEWRYYRDGNAWLCKVQKRKKTIVWMSAWTGYLKTTIYFPAKYLEQVLALDISEELKESIRSSKLRACVVAISNRAAFAEFEKAMLLKLQCK